jgi:hypothetical protein
MALSNFDVSMLSRIAYAWMLAIGGIGASYIVFRILEIGKHHIKKHIIRRFSK